MIFPQGPGHRQTVRLALQVRRTALILSVLLLLCVTSILPAAAAIVREPYIQHVTPTSVTVVWRTDETNPPLGNDSQVQYGTASGQAWDGWPLTATATAVIPPSNSNVTDHIVTVTGLAPGTTYFYAVGTGASGQQAGGTVEHFFVTAPVVGTPTPFRAWIVGDSGDATLDQEAVRDAMLNQVPAPDIFLHMGDIAYNNGTDAEFTTNHFDIYQDILRHTPLWPTLGNHEWVNSQTAGVGPYYEAHVLPTSSSGTEAYYSFDYANVHFIVLNSMSNQREPTDPMLTWLASDLGSTTQEWVIAYFHHPPYTKGTHDSDDSGDSQGRLTDMREKALSILEAGGVDLVLGGHSHIYERSFLLDQAYGYGEFPDFVTPNYSTLLAEGRILDPGDGNSSGDGAYQKNSGGNANDGAVYIVAGHGGRGVGFPFGGNHPVMASVDVQFGSVLLDVNGHTLTVNNLRANETISDTFTIQKIPSGNNVPPNGVIDTPTVNQIIKPGESVTFSGTGIDPDGSIPLTYLWDFDDPLIADSAQKDPGPITFSTEGIYTVTLTVTDALGLSDPTPASVQITVQNTQEIFTAYNDLAWGTGQLTTNITTITSPNGGSGLASSGQLLDFATGLPTPVSLTVTGGSFIGDAQAAHGAEPSPGTDAHALFAGNVSSQGALSYLNQANSPLVLTFTGLDPSKLYDLAYFAHRNKYAWDRASLVTLSGQDAFINISSTATDNPNGPGGALFSGPTDPATRLPADNDNGYVARFRQVDPGSDGVVVLTISFDGTAPYKGKYGSAVRLVESALGGPPPVTTDPNLSTVSTSAASVVANGVDSATITVTLVDVTGAPRVGHTVTLEDGPASSNIGPASGPSDANGQVSFAVTHTTAEVVTYTATDTTDAVTVTQTTDVTFTAPAPSGFYGLQRSGVGHRPVDHQHHDDHLAEWGLRARLQWPITRFRHRAAHAREPDRHRRQLYR